MPSKPGEFVAIYGNDSDNEDVCIPGRIRMWITETVRYFSNAEPEVQFKGKAFSKTTYLFGRSTYVLHMFHCNMKYLVTFKIGISYSRAKGLKHPSKDLKDKMDIYVEDDTFTEFGVGAIIDEVQGIQILTDTHLNKKIQGQIVAVPKEEAIRIQAVAKVNFLFNKHYINFKQE